MAKRIGELLVEAGVLSQTQLEQALFAQRKEGRKLGQLLIELGLVSETHLTQTLSRQLTVPWVSLYHVDFSRSLLNLVPREVAEAYCLVPIFVRRVRKVGETLYVALEDPTNEQALQEASRAANLPVKPMIACMSDIRAAIRVYYAGEEIAPPVSSVASGAPIAAAPPPVMAPVPPPRAPRASRPDIPPRMEAVPNLDSGRTSDPGRASDPGRTSDPGRPIDADRASEPPASEGAPRPHRAKMISLTLLDGTTISVPAPPKRSAKAEEHAPREVLNDQLTARDLVSALRAVAHGADASEILGGEPRWETMFAALLSILLRKGLIADWEFVDEFRRS